MRQYPVPELSRYFVMEGTKSTQWHFQVCQNAISLLARLISAYKASSRVLQAWDDVAVCQPSDSREERY